MDITQFKTGFIGAGNMGGAILKGFVNQSGDTDWVYVTGKNPEKNMELAEKLGINYCQDARKLVEETDLVFLSVKPNVVADVLEIIRPAWNSKKVLVSMAAGVSIEFLESRLPEASAIIRIMPNTPAQVGQAMISMSPNKNVNERMLAAATSVLNSVGQVEQVPEELIHCVIGVSGSSPAYTYMYIGALAQAAVENGMDQEAALKFAAQSVLGAAQMVLETGESTQVLCDKVCSPNGTTIEAVNKLRELGFEELVKKGFQAAVDRSIEMTEEGK